jgi:two-component system cell cycle sensor histidine kinase/response regulator CckA
MPDPLEAQADAQGRAALLERALAELLGEILLWDAAGRLLFASPSALRRLGLAPELVLTGRCCAELPVPAALVAALEEGLRSALAGQTTARRLATQLSLASRPLLTAEGRPWAALTWLRPGVVTDALDEPPPDAEVTPWEDAEGLVASFHEHFEFAEFGSSLVDCEGRLRAVNLASCALLGLASEALVGRTFAELFTPEVAAKWRQRIDEVVRTRRPSVREDHVFTAQREAWFLSVLAPLSNPRGRIIGVQSMSHDISPLRREAARARLEAAIVEVSRGLVGCSAAQTDAAVVAALQTMATVLGADAAALLQGGENGGVAGAITPTHRWGGDPGDPLILASEPLLALLTARGESVLGLPDLRHMAAPAALRAALRDDPCSLVFVPVQTEGALIGGLLLRWSAAPARPWPPLASLPVLADLLLAVLRRARAEAALQRSEADLRRAQGLARIGSYVFDLRGGATQWSEEARRLIGFRSEDEALPLAESVQRFIHPDDRDSVLSDVARIIADGGILEREMRVMPLQGPPREVQIVTEAQRDASGEVTQLHGTVLDVSERRRLESQLLHAQKMEAVGRLAGGVAHDFNNLLTVILGGTAALQLELQDGPLGELIAEIDDAGRRATALTRQLLAFSRRQVLVPVELDLGKVVRESLRVLSRMIGEDITLELALTNEALPVVADASQVEQVLLNLVVNAREAMPAGGRLKIATALVRRGKPGATGPLQPWSLLIVSDSGCGVDAEIKARMFEPFFTTKPRGQGSGLGLSTVHAVVDGLGGYVEVDSAVGVGTELRVYLPARRAPGPTPRILPPRASELRGHETVLVVEDEDGVRNLVKRVLDDRGYHVIAARDGEEALRICAEVAVDLVLTDVIMPGITGHVLAARLRARRPTRVLFMSGYDPEDAPAGGLLRKPFRPNELASRVREALDLPVPNSLSLKTDPG